MASYLVTFFFFFLSVVVVYLSPWATIQGVTELKNTVSYETVAVNKLKEVKNTLISIREKV